MLYFICLLLNSSLFLFSIKSWVFLKSKKSNYSNFIDLFYLVFFYNIISHGILVDILRIISDGKVNIEYNVSDLEIFEVTFYEWFSNILYLFIFFYFTLYLLKNKKYKSPNINLQFFILTFFSLGSMFVNLLPSIFENTFLWLFKSSFSNMGAICSIILLVHAIRLKNNKLKIIGLTNMGLIFFVNIIMGLRGSIVGISIILLCYSYIQLPKANFKRLIYISVFPLILVIFIGNYLGNLKAQFNVNLSNNQFNRNSVVDYYRFATDFFSSNIVEKTSDNNFVENLLTEIEYRYGAPSLFGVGFIRMYDKGMPAGFKTEQNSFYSFLPRQIIGENKPVSGSFDGTEQGMGMYACFKEITGAEGVMSDFYVSSHYYWQFGIFGIFFFSIIAGLFSFFMLLFTSNFLYIGHALWLACFKSFWLLPKLWVSEMLIMTSTIIIPTLFLIFLCKFIFGITRMITKKIVN